ncbi:hypothetical protein CBM2586_B10179 [Cupriavidus phytorum]|uniref:Rhamnogalacturonase A/B/Epimerase-like pectate lyase domain-containing protein n=1 Tax=Cupriavidus taiwanensis TaxID=164546 RepID=A0A375C994_9BURK|nr:glycosyl hydrolase family 28-related protein [Cupriavidus taiwanensis]SOY65584.1 hypothetical protein CBM2586_B10179 [Cupriavidus taiwanensis]
MAKYPTQLLPFWKGDGVQQIADASNPDAGPLDGAEFATVSRGSGVLKTTLTAIGTWVLGTFLAFTQTGVGAIARTILAKLFDLPVTPQDFGAVGDGSNDDTAAIRAAIATGKSVYFPKPNSFYRITDEIGPKFAGQILFTNCRLRGMIRNTTNDKPLAYFGDPTVSNGATPQAGMRGLTFFGNAATTRGIVLSTVNENGSAWTDASKDCSLHDVAVDFVGNGWALECYSWCNDIRNFTSYEGNKRGAIFAVDANQNNVSGLYVTGCAEQSLQVGAHPTSTRVSRGNSFRGVVVQQSGGADGVVVIADADNTTITGLYSESNNVKGAPRAVFVKDTARGTVINGVSHLSGGAVVIKNEGLGTSVDGVVSSNITGAIVENAGVGTLNLGTVEWMAGVTPSGVKFSDSSVGGRATFLDNIYSGLWTPTVTALTNVDAVTAFECQYSRVGNVITFSGQVNIDPTATGLTEIGMSLPVASNLIATRQAAGTYSSNSSTIKDGGAIYGDSTNKRLTFRHVAGSTSNLSFFFSGSYLVRT